MRLDALVCDLDGVVYRGSQPIPGAADAVNALRREGVRVVFSTNNSRPTVAQYVARLAGFGIETGLDDIVTSAVVTAEVLAERSPAGRRALVIGGDGVEEALASIGVTIDSGDSGDVDLVVVGWDPGFDYQGMKRAAFAVRAGAEFIATNADAAFPVPDGLWPGAGAILASIEVASGRKAEVMGKPHAPMMDAVARRVAGAERVAVVGDRPETDLAGGKARGWTTILVTSGVTHPDRAGEVDPQPDLILGSLPDLVQRLQLGSQRGR
ncbi:MAG: HAD-IIA family hydrolase [Actinomycetota bacterium]